ncbi:hypothetical protein CSOJ01_07594 [Colletotrichum sojae]|uniref:Uncharacterized protein n=1 Tax=Colletotrichum sojae TaxID=2175907 RepID=A0A8H6MTB3_9PEZI|nr:hypothetical protein CSOJ01_07594 [Colletotrichum sojae]
MFRFKPCRSKAASVSCRGLGDIRRQLRQNIGTLGLWYEQGLTASPAQHTRGPRAHHPLQGTRETFPKIQGRHEAATDPGDSALQPRGADERETFPE